MATISYTIKTDVMDDSVKWASFTHDGVYYEIRATLDSNGDVDDTKTQEDCQDYIELKQDEAETV